MKCSKIFLISGVENFITAFYFSVGRHTKQRKINLGNFSVHCFNEKLEFYVAYEGSRGFSWKLPMLERMTVCRAGERMGRWGSSEG